MRKLTPTKPMSFKRWQLQRAFSVAGYRGPAHYPVPACYDDNAIATMHLHDTYWQMLILECLVNEDE